MSKNDSRLAKQVGGQYAVTICMPVYNGEKFIRRALDSLLRQTFTDFVLIISDNASKDKTAAICKEYKRKDSRIKYIRHDRNMGAAANFNALMDLVQTKYFFFAPHDDEWLEDWVYGAVRVLDAQSDASIVLGTIDFVSGERRLVGRASPPWKLDQKKPLDRLWRYLHTDVTDHLIYGVIRSSVISTFRLGLRETSPEKALIFTILARGKVADCSLMKMINHMSHKTQDELHAVFQFEGWYLANLKTHISTVKALFRELQSATALRAAAYYFSEIIARRFFGKRRMPGNVELFTLDDVKELA